MKELHRTTKAIAQINADWKVEKAQYAEFNAPTCDKIGVWQLCKERQPLWNCHDSWWPELKMFGSMPLCSFPRQKLVPKLGQKNCHTTTWIYPIADSILVSDQTDLFSFATYGDEYGVPRKALPRKQANVDTGHQIRPMVICPRALFKWKNFIEQLKLILKWMLIEKRRRPSMLSSMCQHVQGLTLKHPCCGPNWFIQFCPCGDEYCVPRKPLPRKQANVHTGHQILPGLAQGSFQWKNLIEQLKLLLKLMLIERWRRPSMLSSMRQHVTRLQFDSCAKKHSLSGTVMMAWIWHVWINAMVFVPTAKAPPKAGASALSYNSLNLSLNLSMKDNTYYSGQHPCFGPSWFIQLCNTWRWIRYA